MLHHLTTASAPLTPAEIAANLIASPILFAIIAALYRFSHLLENGNVERLDRESEED